MAAISGPDPDKTVPWIGSLLVRSAARPQPTVLAGGVAVALSAIAVFAVDWLTGPELTELIVYVGLVGVMAWRYPQPVGYLMAVTGAATGASVSLWHGSADLAGHVVAINGVFRMTVLLAFSFGTSLLRRTLHALDDYSKLDPLTGLLNRRALWELAERERARAIRNGTPIVIAYCDLDGLKKVNDDRGHDAGDRLISDFAEALRSALRTTDLVARMGGDEFAIVLPEANLDNAVGTIRRVLEQPGVPTASVGVVGWASDFPDVETMVSEADVLMFRAKQEQAGILHRQAKASA